MLLAADRRLCAARRSVVSVAPETNTGQYRWDRIRQDQLDTEVNYACPIPARHKPDGMSEGQGDQVDPLFSPVAGSEWARERSRRRPGVRAG
jgi:hypothetical protein